MEIKDTYLTVENGIVDINDSLFFLRGLNNNNKTDKEIEELINKYHSYHMSTEKELWIILAVEDLTKTHEFLCINLTKNSGTFVEMGSIENVYNWIDNKKLNDIKRINEGLHNNDFFYYNQHSIN